MLFVKYSFVFLLWKTTNWKGLAGLKKKRRKNTYTAFRYSPNKNIKEFYPGCMSLGISPGKQLKANTLGKLTNWPCKISMENHPENHPK